MCDLMAWYRKSILTGALFDSADIGVGAPKLRRYVF
jgi:hypothetical protein